MQTSSVQLFNDRTTTGYSEKHQASGVYRSFQAMGATSAGAGAATILIQVSNVSSPNEANDVDWLTLGTISLTLGTTQTTDGFSSAAGWRHVRAKVSAISGTNAAVDVWMGV